MKVVLAGPGAFGIKHLDGIRNIDGVEVISLVGRNMDKTRATADEYGIAHATTDLAEALAQTGVDAAILCTPTQQHAAEAIQCMQAGVHVQTEIPLADTWKDAQAVNRTQQETGLVCMVGHTRRFNPSHQWIQKRIASGEVENKLVTGNLESERDFTDVRDVARAYRLLIEQGSSGKAYNIASGNSVKIRKMVDILCDILGVAPLIETDPSRYRPADKYPMLDTSSIEADVGWHPEIELRQSLVDILSRV